MAAEVFEKIPAKKRVLKQKTLVIDREPVFVRTEWEGRDLSHGEAPVPMIYATYVFSQTRPNMCFATPDKEKALMGHEMMVGFVRGQGAKSGLAVVLNSMVRAFLQPRSIKHGWFMVILFAIVVAVQGLALLSSLVFSNWSWGDLIPGIAGPLYGYALFRSAQGLRRLRKERKAKLDEERRLEDERKAFDNIIGPLR